MADHLIPYVEFLGLPGSGKSYFSHKVAESLRADGLIVTEPSWELDHTTSKYIRAIRKIMMAWLFTLCHRCSAKGIKVIIKNCSVSDDEVNRFQRNILYKAYLLNKRKEDVLFFDEGLAQMAVSLSVKTNKTAREIYNEVQTVLSLKQDVLLIRIDCSVETALLNMEKRSSHDSHVEQLSGLDAKREYLNLYKGGCETISEPHSLTVTCNQNDSELVQTIVNFIKKQLEKQ